MNYEDQTLADIACLQPRATEILRKNRLDFCCGGRQTLAEACRQKNVDVHNVITQIKEMSKIKERNNDFSKMPVNELVDYILNTYHTSLRIQLPELIMLAEKVEKVHSDHINCPKGISSLLKEMWNQMQMHLMKEENILFPMIKNGQGSMAYMPIQVMHAEHDAHGVQLETLHQLTQDFTPPSGACPTWVALYKGVENLEKELMEHIHLENNILFKRVLLE